MDSERTVLTWFSNLRNQINTLCSETSEIITLEPIVYVRNELLTVGENIKQFCTEVIPRFIMSSLEEKDAPESPNWRENAGFPAYKKLSVITNDDQETISDIAANSPSSPNPSKDSVLVSAELDEVGNDGLKEQNFEKNECNRRANSTSVRFSELRSCENTEETINSEVVKFNAMIEEYNLPCGWSTEDIQSNAEILERRYASCHKTWEKFNDQFSWLAIPNLDLPHDVEGGEAPDCPVMELGNDSTRLIDGQHLEKSFILLDGDKFHSNAGTEEDYIFHQETDLPPLQKKKKKKFAGKHRGEIFSQAIKLDTDKESDEILKGKEDHEESKILGEDDWEIV